MSTTLPRPGPQAGMPMQPAPAALACCADQLAAGTEAGTGKVLLIIIASGSVTLTRVR